MRPTQFSLFILDTKHRYREAQARRGEEPDYDPDQFQDPDNEYGLFAGTTYEADDEEADKIYEQVDQNMDARRRVRRYVYPSAAHCWCADMIVQRGTRE